jgi:hypothetical protein
MTLGISIMAAGRQRAWAVIQFQCILVSAIADPILIPWFQARAGNGSLGVATTMVLNEALMVIGGLWLSAKGLFVPSVLKTFLSTALGATAMASIAWLLRGLTPFVAAPLSVVGYCVAVWLTGGVDRDQMDKLFAFFRQKLSRRR